MITKTYTLRSNDWIHTPSLIRMAVDQFVFNPDWSIKLLREGYQLPPKIAKGLASGKIPFWVEEESVVFNA